MYVANRRAPAPIYRTNTFGEKVRCDGAIHTGDGDGTSVGCYRARVYPGKRRPAERGRFFREESSADASQWQQCLFVCIDIHIESKIGGRLSSEVVRRSPFPGYTSRRAATYKSHDHCAMFTNCRKTRERYLWFFSYQ